MSDSHQMAPNDVEERISDIFITVNRSAMRQLKLSFQNHSNASSNLILEELLKEHSAHVDDQSPNGVDNFSEAISYFIPNKHMVRNSKNWKSNLRSFSDSLDLKNLEVGECKNITHCNSTNVKLEYLNRFLDNKHETPSHLLTPVVSGTTTHEKNYVPSTPLPDVKKHFTLQSFSIEQKKVPNRKKTELKPPSDVIAQLIKTDVNKVKSNENRDPPPVQCTFKTAREQLLSSNPAAKRSLGTSRKGLSKFVSPFLSEIKEDTYQPEVTEERLKHICPKMVELIQSEIIDNSTPIEWDEIAGLKTAKSVIQEAVVWPLLRPDIFTGLRRPPKGVLLFGPPGTGKTLIGKCVASQCKATFFNISASSLTSKWIGDGEKMVRALFAVAKTCQPAVVFVDEIDSLLTQRSNEEHEATRRIKTEFLVQFDGAGTSEDDRILIIGATNRPQELDEAARRRLVKRLYIPLPDCEARKQIVTNLMRTQANSLSASDVDEVSRLSDGYSGADMRSLCSEAAMGPIRSLPLSQIVSVQSSQVRPVSMDDFRSALQRVRPSVSQADLAQYIEWNTTYGFGQ